MRPLFSTYQVVPPSDPWGPIYFVAETDRIAKKTASEMGFGAREVRPSQPSQIWVNAAVRTTLRMRARREFSRPLVYLAAPVKSWLMDGRTVAENLSRADAFLADLTSGQWLDVICPWLAEMRAVANTTGGDIGAIEEAGRAEGLARSVAVASRCDGIVLAGNRVSDGMAEEMNAVMSAGGFVMRMRRPIAIDIGFEQQMETMMSLTRFDGEP